VILVDHVEEVLKAALTKPLPAAFAWQV